MWLLDKFDRKQITSEVISTTNSLTTLKILSLGRIDVNLENDSNLKTAFKDTGLSPADFKTFVAKSKPVGVYFGKAFLQREPEFLDIFNISIKACIKSQPALSGRSGN